MVRPFRFCYRFYEPTSLPIRLRGQVRAVCTRRGVRRAAASAGFEPASSSIACGTCPAERSGGSSWSRTTFYRFSVGRYHSTSSRPENVAPSEGAADFRWIKDPLRYRCATRRGEGSRLVDGAGFEPATVFACGAPSSGTTWHPRSESNRHPPGENRRSWPLDDEGTKRVRLHAMAEREGIEPSLRVLEARPVTMTLRSMCRSAMGLRARARPEPRGRRPRQES